MDERQHIARLLVSCPDRHGIIAAVSGFLVESDANILSSDRHSTDPEGARWDTRSMTRDHATVLLPGQGRQLTLGSSVQVSFKEPFVPFINYMASGRAPIVAREIFDQDGHLKDKLIGTGPFSLVRNPLYLGNMALWAGFAVSARLVWLAPLIVAWLGLERDAGDAQAG